MTLDEWLTSSGTPEEAFAASILTSQAAVNRYRRKLRTPRPEIMARIVAATKGSVTPNDFYTNPAR
ncbi:transcriptional regulator [Azospirillum brasilense]|uniref:Transcriptional regulator n=1 Tax=Azospirillum brasilense TaxID=192 RepID=A0A235H596_AZOBR|nr:transcriptional regulator [Azospirillum brasilense]OYD80958.1 transcriptional regulator [Azospirillum brasilense]QCO18883.1 XRE family transcriptional regulator [Azospirillum brasilense]